MELCALCEIDYLTNMCTALQCKTLNDQAKR